MFVKDYFSLKSKSYSFNFLGTIKKYTIGLPSLILKSFSSNEEKSKFKVNEPKIYEIKEKEKELFEKLSQKLINLLSVKYLLKTMACFPK